MGKSRATALVAALMILGLAVMRTATASHGGDHDAFSGGATFKGLVVKTAEAVEPGEIEITADEPDWQTVDSRGFSIPAGESQLIEVDVNTFARCDQVESVGFCLMRVVVGRSLPSAVELEPSGFSGILLRPGVGLPERRSINRALCVQNVTASPANISVWVQASRAADGSDLSYSIFDYVLKIARSTPCTPSVTI